MSFTHNFKINSKHTFSSGKELCLFRVKHFPGLLVGGVASMLWAGVGQPTFRPCGIGLLKQKEQCLWDLLDQLGSLYLVMIGR